MNDASLKDFKIATEMNALETGAEFEVGDALFERISPEKIEELKTKYGSGK